MALGTAVRVVVVEARRWRMKTVWPMLALVEPSVKVAPVTDEVLWTAALAEPVAAGTAVPLPLAAITDPRV